jgi:predicted acetyltransferase
MRWEATAQVDPSAPGVDKRRVLAVHLDSGGVADGALAYAVKDEYLDRTATATLTVEDLVTSTDAAYADLWRYAAEVDFVNTVVAPDRSPAEPLPLLLEDARAARDSAVSDFLWIRLHDVPAALTARRYAVPGTLVLDVADPLDQVTGRYRLEVDDALSVTCVPTSEPADVALGVGDLGSLLMGGSPGTTSVAALRRAGRLTASDEAAARATAMFSWSEPAWCGTWF